MRKYRDILLLLLVLGALRLCFVTKGHLFWIDELRYTNAFLFYDALGQGDLKRACWYLFHAHGRPGFVLLSAIPAGMQLLSQKIGLISLGDPQFMEYLRRDKMTMGFNPHFFDIAGMFNVFVSLAAAFIFFKILKLLTVHERMAYAGVILYSGLVNTNFYIRHLVPYDMSLLLFFIPLYLVLREIVNKNLQARTAAVSGLFSASAFSVYPSYYLFVLLIASLFLISPQKRIAGFFLHVFAFAALLGVMEMVSQWAGNPYFKSLWELSAIATQGTFGEGYIFPLRYLLHVEGSLGIVLLSLFILFLGVAARKAPLVIKVAYFILLSGYLYHATQGVVFKKMVFYGRLMHMYFPFLVLAAVLFIDSLNNHRLRSRLVIAVVFVSILSFLSFLKQFTPLEYPLDFGQRYASRLPSGAVYRTNEQTLPDRAAIRTAPGVLVNAEYFHPLRVEWYPLDTPLGMKLVKAALHPLHFPAYQYEGHSLEDRQRLRQREITMRFYARDYLAGAFKNEKK